MARERFRRETGLRPEDRGEAMAADRDDRDGAEAASETTEATGWSVNSICTVNGRTPTYSDPTTGGVDTTEISGRSGVDPPPHRD